MHNARVVLEKPLGHDLASAQKINDDVGQYFQEQQIFRIDHYLGKETVQNLMVLRFGNTIFEPLWRSPHIKSVQITVAESVGVGSRAGFYDGTGAMRDMIQNHLLQLLCIVAMEPPVSLDPDAVRDEKLKVLRSLRPMSIAEVAKDTVRGQYSAGASKDGSAIGYLQEDNVPADSRTETFVALKAHINNWRWANVPIFLRTGKRMAERRSEIVIEFADLPFTIFNDSPRQSVNRLMIRLQPEEHVQLHMMAKEPGSGMKLRPVHLNLDLESAFTERRAEAYERLLIDVIKGRLTHFMRRDELEAAWTWVDPIIDGWKQLNEKPKAYTAGTWGPAASSALMAREDSSWVEESNPPRLGPPPPRCTRPPQGGGTGGPAKPVPRCPRFKAPRACHPTLPGSPYRSHFTHLISEPSHMISEHPNATPSVLAAFHRQRTACGHR